MNVALHFQTPAATAIACRSDCDRIEFNVIPEIPYYIGPVVAVPYALPGTLELAESVTASMKAHDMVIMRNHGQVTVGRTYDDTIQKALFFELACEAILRAGEGLQALTREDVRTLREFAQKGTGYSGP